jgi:hypothetical protein
MIAQKCHPSLSLSLAKMQSAFIFIALRHDTCLGDQLALNR